MKIQYVIAVALFMTLQIGVQTVAQTAAAPGELQGLRNLAQKKGMDIGAAINFKLLNNAAYTKAAKSEFSVITPENEMKWGYIESTKNSFDWFFGDQMLAFAEANGQKFRGHALVWHSQVAQWVREIKTREEMLEAVRNHCATIVSHYKGRIQKWDVVNECIDDKSGMRPTEFNVLTGTDFIDVALKAAHEADPDCLLYINDYSVEDINPKSDRLYELCKSLLAKGIPLNGVGFQSHWEIGAMPNMQSVKANIERFVKLGLKVDITELDIRYKLPRTDDLVKQQVEAYKAILDIILQTDGTDSITLWGVDDGHSWIKGFKPSYGEALILDNKYKPKPAYYAFVEAFTK